MMSMLMEIQEKPRISLNQLKTNQPIFKVNWQDFCKERKQQKYTNYCLTFPNHIVFLLSFVHLVHVQSNEKATQQKQSKAIKFKSRKMKKSEHNYEIDCLKKIIENKIE